MACNSYTDIKDHECILLFCIHSVYPFICQPSTGINKHGLTIVQKNFWLKVIILKKNGDRPYH